MHTIQKKKLLHKTIYKRGAGPSQKKCNTWPKQRKKPQLHPSTHLLSLRNQENPRASDPKQGENWTENLKVSPWKIIIKTT